MTLHHKQDEPAANLPKIPTGINGLDEITEGGLPKNRPTIICGNAGSGKTVLSMEFLINGAVRYNEPGVFISFEETTDNLISNMRSLHFNVSDLIKNGKMYVENFDVDKTEIIVSGSYNLEGLFVRLQYAIDKVGGKRIVIDSLDALFGGRLNAEVVRTEITRLFKWFSSKKITAIITSENDDQLISTLRAAQHVADCVIALDNRISNQIASRRLRIIKMRGSSHGINEYPFVIDKDGISVLPIISELKSPKLSTNRISSGIDEFDNMLDGKGFFEGSSILVSGSAGTGKTSLAVSLLNSTCKREKRCLYCAFEESSAQIARNMYSIGINLDPFIKSGILEFYCSRPTLKNLELHLIAIHKIIDNFKPEVIIMDPVTNLMSEGINSEIRQMLTHFTDYLRSKNITAVFTAAITLESIKTNSSDEGISAMMDTWVLLSDIEKNSECNRGIHILKSRGMNHSTQVREFKITNNGINILPTFIGSEGILTGSAKLEYILQQEEHRIVREKKFKTEEEEIERKRKVMHEKIALLMLSLESEIDTLNLIKSEDKLLQQVNKESKTKIINSRNQFEGPVQY